MLSLNTDTQQVKLFEQGVLVGGEAPTEPGADEAVVVLHRAGEMVVPVEVEIRFADDTTVRRIWSGTRRTHTLQFDKHVRSVRLDPEGKLLLEAVRLDNHRFAPGEDFDDGLSQPLGQAAETAALLVLTGVGP